MSTKNDLLSLQQFFYDIDYGLLRKQKTDLIRSINIDSDNVDSLSGLLNLIDSIQDYAADVVGIESVFQEEKEE